MTKLTLAAARTNAGLTQAEAAKTLGISEVTLRAWESGKKKMKAYERIAVSVVYKMPIENIFFETDIAKGHKKGVQ